MCKGRVIDGCSALSYILAAAMLCMLTEARRR
jgi:hypothetical protein